MKKKTHATTSIDRLVLRRVRALHLNKRHQHNASLSGVTEALKNEAEEGRAFVGLVFSAAQLNNQQTTKKREK